jgi:hypothetical protein
LILQTSVELTVVCTIGSALLGGLSISRRNASSNASDSAKSRSRRIDSVGCVKSSLVFSVDFGRIGAFTALSASRAEQTAFRSYRFVPLCAAEFSATLHHP